MLSRDACVTVSSVGSRKLLFFFFFLCSGNSQGCEQPVPQHSLHRRCCGEGEGPEGCWARCVAHMDFSFTRLTFVLTSI